MEEGLFQFRSSFHFCTFAVGLLLSLSSFPPPGEFVKSKERRGKRNDLKGLEKGGERDKERPRVGGRNGEGKAPREKERQAEWEKGKLNSIPLICYTLRQKKMKWGMRQGNARGREISFSLCPFNFAKGPLRKGRKKSRIPAEMKVFPLSLETDP